MKIETLSLLERAKIIASRRQNDFSEQELELALAWFQGGLSIGQVVK